MKVVMNIIPNPHHNWTTIVISILHLGQAPAPFRDSTSSEEHSSHEQAKSSEYEGIGILPIACPHQNASDWWAGQVGETDDRVYHAHASPGLAYIRRQRRKRSRKKPLYGSAEYSCFSLVIMLSRCYFRNVWVQRTVENSPAVEASTIADRNPGEQEDTADERCGGDHIQGPHVPIREEAG